VRSETIGHTPLARAGGKEKGSKGALSLDERRVRVLDVVAKGKGSKQVVLLLRRCKKEKKADEARGSEGLSSTYVPQGDEEGGGLDPVLLPLFPLVTRVGERGDG